MANGVGAARAAVEHDDQRIGTAHARRRLRIVRRHVQQEGARQIADDDVVRRGAGRPVATLAHAEYAVRRTCGAQRDDDCQNGSLNGTIHNLHNKPTPICAGPPRMTTRCTPALIPNPDGNVHASAPPSVGRIPPRSSSALVMCPKPRPGTTVPTTYERPYTAPTLTGAANDIEYAVDRSPPRERAQPTFD